MLELLLFPALCCHTAVQEVLSASACPSTSHWAAALQVDELREGLRKKGTLLGMQEVQEILDKIDVNGNSRIDYEVGKRALSLCVLLSRGCEACMKPVVPVPGHGRAPAAVGY